VTGLTETQAIFVLGRLGLSTNAIATASRKRKGEVIRTEPDAGAELPVPGEVALIVSEGREVVAVPDLEGRHLDDVDVLLSSLGLLLGSVTFEPGAVGAPGRVIGQAPPPGFGLREGGEVSIRVAGSPSDVIRVDEGGQSH
jgi:serine/threonine-protein kinase